MCCDRMSDTREFCSYSVRSVAVPCQYYPVREEGNYCAKIIFFRFPKFRYEGVKSFQIMVAFHGKLLPQKRNMKEV